MNLNRVDASGQEYFTSYYRNVSTGNRPDPAVATEDETLETSTQREQLSGDSSYPAWVYILSGLLGIIITGGALLFISRRV